MKLVCGNWKMNHDHLQTVSTLQELAIKIRDIDLSTVNVVVHPPFVDLRTAQTVIQDRHIPIHLGAQNCHHEESGAYTGEVSAAMLARLSVGYVIAGHSERRRLFHESDEDVALKVAAILRHGMTPVICVGEDESERDAGHTEQRLIAQVIGALSAIKKNESSLVIFAYEPLWAIGTGNAATAYDVSDAGEIIAHAATKVSHQVLYGGSVTAANAAELVKKGKVDGLLVGGASLSAQSFGDIIQAVSGGLSKAVR